MFLLPERFDVNEWVIIGLYISNIYILWKLPRRFPMSVTILLYLYGILVSASLDDMLGTPPYDLYDVNDDPKYELFDLLMYVIYPVYSYYFIYVIDRWRIRGLGLFLYLLIVSLSSTGYEWIMVQANIFTYNGWTLVNSYPVYLISQSLLLLYYLFLKHQLIKRK